MGDESSRESYKSSEDPTATGSDPDVRIRWNPSDDQDQIQDVYDTTEFSVKDINGHHVSPQRERRAITPGSLTAPTVKDSFSPGFIPSPK